MSRKERGRGTVRLVSGADPPPERASTPSVMRCPRCGGVSTVRPRAGGMRNPFLSKKKPELLTCEDCGLDFEKPTSSERDSERESGRSPWSKP